METLQEAVDYLKIHEKDIDQKAQEGNLLCQRIIGFYQMVVRSPDNGSIAFLISSIEEYQKVKYTL